MGLILLVNYFTENGKVGFHRVGEIELRLEENRCANSIFN